MKALFYGIPLTVFTMVQFDTQDRIFRKNFDWEWQQQTLKTDRVNRESYKGKDILRVKTEKPTKWIYLNNFKHSYKVKKVSQNEFIVYCKDWQKHWDQTDIINILFIN